MVAYSSAPVPLEIDANQFGVFMLGLAIMITLVAALLVLEMRR
jgi:hypothetical protein